MTITWELHNVAVSSGAPQARSPLERRVRARVTTETIWELAALLSGVKTPNVWIDVLHKRQLSKSARLARGAPTRHARAETESTALFLDSRRWQKHRPPIRGWCVCHDEQKAL